MGTKGQGAVNSDDKELKFMNFRGTANLGTELDLGSLQDTLEKDSSIRECTNKSKILTLRLPWSRAIARVWADGKMEVYYAETEKDLLHMISFYRSTIQLLDNNVRLGDVAVTGMNAVVKLGFKIDMKELGKQPGLRRISSQELRYKFIDPPMTVKIFKSGALEFCGAKSEDDVRSALVITFAVVKNYKLRRKASF